MAGGRARRVMHLVANLERGGAQEVVRTLAPRLRDAGWQPSVLAFRDGPLRPALEDDGVDVILVDPRRHGLLGNPPAALLDLFRLRREVARAIDEQQPLVLQTHLLRSLDFLVWSLRRPPVRAVAWTAHNSVVELRADQLPGRRWPLAAKRAAYRTLYRTGSRHGCAFVAVSAEVARSIEDRFGVAPGNITVIPNGIDVDRYPTPVDRALVRRSLGIAPDAMVIISVAKLYRQKGHETLLDAFAQAIRQGLDAQLLVVGDGPLRAEVEVRVRESGVASRVHLLGQRTDVDALLAASDLFVLASLWEGLPMALLEAMASRLPIIATAVSGSVEVVEPEVSGLLVAPRDARALAGALLRACRDAELAARLAVAARSRVEAAFSVSGQARAHADLYDRLAGLSGPARSGGSAA